METKVTTVEGVTIATLSGRFDASAAPEAEHAFNSLLGEQNGRFVLDFSGVEYISSGGLRAVLSLSKTVEKRNGRLMLCGLNPFVTEVFSVSRFSTLFEIRPDQATAIDAFRQSVGED